MAKDLNLHLQLPMCSLDAVILLVVLVILYDECSKTFIMTTFIHLQLMSSVVHKESRLLAHSCCSPGHMVHVTHLADGVSHTFLPLLPDKNKVRSLAPEVEALIDQPCSCKLLLHCTLVTDIPCFTFCTFKKVYKNHINNVCSSVLNVYWVAQHKWYTKFFKEMKDQEMIALILYYFVCSSPSCVYKIQKVSSAIDLWDLQNCKIILIS